jgi:hypothetical protein
LRQGRGSGPSLTIGSEAKAMSKQYSMIVQLSVEKCMEFFSEFLATDVDDFESWIERRVASFVSQLVGLIDGHMLVVRADLLEVCEDCSVVFGLTAPYAVQWIEVE